MEFCKNKEKCCCFTGHRPHKLGMSEDEAKKLLSEVIDRIIKKGYTTFISGMAQGIDLWAAEIVLEKREKNPEIFLLCASPYKGVEDKWKNEERKRYRSVIELADDVEYINSHYTPYCFITRNNWMVNHSSLVVAGYNYSDGGTKQTVNYASKQGKDVYNILTNEFI